MRHLRQFETDFSEDLSKRQVEALPSLLKPGSLSEQARNAGIARATLYRWLEDDSFRSALQRLREQTMEIAESEMLAMTYEATGVVYDTLRDEDKNLRFKAAQTILQQAHDTKYGHDLLRRVETLREALRLRKDFDWRTYAYRA